MELVYRLGWTLMHSLWEGAAVAAVVAVLLCIVPRRAANARYLCLMFAMLGMLTALAVTYAFSPQHHAVPQIAVVQTPVVGRDAIPISNARSPVLRVSDLSSSSPRSRSVSAMLSRWIEQLSPAVGEFWIGGVLLLGAWRIGVWMSIQRLRVAKTEPVDATVLQVARGLATRLNIAKPFEVLLSGFIETPMVIGYLRPVILLPASVVTGLSPQQLEGILAHELAHINRGDYVMNLLQITIETLLFYHPAIWWISRQIRLEREQACDDVAVSLCNDRHQYAGSLAALEELRFTVALAAGGSGGRQMVARIRRILQPVDDAPRWGLPTLVSVLLIVTMAAAVYSQSKVASDGKSSPATQPTMQRADVGISAATIGGGAVRSPQMTELDAERKRTADLKLRYEIELRQAVDDVKVRGKDLSELGGVSGAGQASPKSIELNRWVQEQIELETQKLTVDTEFAQLSDIKANGKIPPSVAQAVEKNVGITHAKEAVDSANKHVEDLSETNNDKSPEVVRASEKLAVLRKELAESQQQITEQTLKGYEDDLNWRRENIAQRLTKIDHLVAEQKAEMADINNQSAAMERRKEDIAVYRKCLEEYDHKLQELDEKARQQRDIETQQIATPDAFPFTIGVQQGKTQFLDGDQITITSVKGTGPDMQNGICCITGTYKLASHDKATLAASVTAADAADGKGYWNASQQTEIQKGSGTFKLLLPISVRGWPHVSFYDGNSFGDNYVGTGNWVLK